MKLQIASDQLNRLFHHGETTYPQECCGILLGKIIGDCKTIVEIIPTPNTWDETIAEDLKNVTDFPDRDGRKERNFFIPPEALLKAQKKARHCHAIVLGFYHSHPDAEAIPSESDRAIAWPNYSYMILSIRQQKGQDIRSWQLDETRQFQPETLEILTT